jgi:hypothetical protein
MRTQPIKRFELTEASLADHDGSHYVLHVGEIAEAEARQGDFHECTTIVHFRLERINGNTGKPPMTVKDKRLRYNLGMSKAETVRAFEMMLDMVWAFDRAEGGNHG